MINVRRAVLEQRIAELEQENERLRQDAERYRWLKENMVSCNFGSVYTMQISWLKDSNVDSIIDEARK